MNIPSFPQLRRNVILAAPALALGLLACGGHSHHEVWYTASGSDYQTQAVAIADVQGNGKAAVVSANKAYFQGTPFPGFITVRLQDPLNPERFLDPIETDTDHDPVALALADLTGGTARPDLVVAHRKPYWDSSATASISVQRHDPAKVGGFLVPISLSLGSRNPTDVAVGDLNHDGRPDIAVAADGADTLIVFLQNVDGTFTSTSLPAGGTPTAVAVADLNHDGYQDLAVATASSTVSVMLQDAAHPGQFPATTSIPIGFSPACVKVAALSDPDFPDILTANNGTSVVSTTKGLSVILHDPAQAGSFLPATSYDTGDHISTGLAVGDTAVAGSANSPYIVVANQGFPGWRGSLSVFLSDPAHPGTFLKPMLYDAAWGPNSVAIGEFSSTAVVAADGGTFLRYETSPGYFGSRIQLRQ